MCSSNDDWLQTFSKRNSFSNHRRVATVKALTRDANAVDSSGSSDDSEQSKAGSIIGILKRSVSPSSVRSKPDGADFESSRTSEGSSSRCSTPEERVAFAMEMAGKDDKVKKCVEFYKSNGDWWK